MVANSLETQKTTLKFDSLALLREELGKQTTNPERLDEFQKTIDQALEKGDREGVIEFTEDEWKSLITNEDLPPIEQVKKLLQEKIEGRNEAKIESKEKREGIMGELDKVKKSVEDVKEKATGAVKEVLSPIQKVKEGLEKAQKNLGEMWGNLWMPVKLAWYTLWASLGFKFGKDALAVMTKEKAEKIIEQAKEKVGKIGKGGNEATEEKKEENSSEQKGKEKKESKETNLLTKLGFGAAGVGLFGLVKHMLPSKTQAEFDGNNEESILKNVSKFRAFKLLGGAGIGLFGLSLAYNYYTKNPEILEKIGPRPDDREGQVVWYKKLFTDAGIAFENVEDFVGKGVDIFDGQALKEKYENERPAPGMEYLQDSVLFREPTRMMKMLYNKVELAMAENPKGFTLLLVGLGITFGTGIAFGGLKAAEIVQKILQKLYGNAKQQPILWALGLAAGASGTMNGWEALKHIQVKKDMTEADLQDMIYGIGELEVGEKITEFTGMEMPATSMATIGAAIGTKGEYLCAHISDLMTNIVEKSDNTLRETLEVDRNEKISGAALSGLTAMLTTIKDTKLSKFGGTDSSDEYQNLFGEKFLGGKIREIITKSKNKEPLSESDIYQLIESTRGTNIRIFPAGGERENADAIQWAIIEENGEVGIPKNLCVNPAKDRDEQESIAEEFSVDTVVEWSKITTQGYNTIRYDIISEIGKALLNKSGETRGLIERAIDTGFTFFKVGTKLMVQYGTSIISLGQAESVGDIFSGDKEVNAKEMLVNYAGSLVPVLIITSIKNGVLGKNEGMLKFLGKTVCETATYPIKTINAGRYIYKKWGDKDLAGILRDPAIVVRDGIAGLAKRFTGLVFDKASLGILKMPGENLKTKGQLQKWNSMLHDIKIQEDIGKTPDQLHSQFEGLKKFFEKHHNLQKALGKDAAYSPNIHHGKIDEMIREARNGLRNFDDTIRRGLPAITEVILSTYEQQLAASHPDEHLRKKYAAGEQKTKEQELFDLEGKRKNLKEELENAKKNLNRRPSDGNLQALFTAADDNLRIFEHNFADKHLNLRTEIVALENAQHLNTSASHIRTPGAQIKHLGKGVLGIVGIFGAGYGINKAAIAIHGESHEEDYVKENTDFYGYEKDADNHDREFKNMEKSVEENSKNTEGCFYECETFDEFKERVQVIENEYKKELGGFMDTEWIQKTSPEDAKEIIKKLSTSHIKKVSDIKKLISANKGMVEKFWDDKYPNGLGEEVIPKELRDMKVTAFMYLTKNKDKLMLELMNQTDFERTLFLLYDGTHQSGFDAVVGKTGTAVVKGGLSLIPFAGNAVAGYEAYESFSKGNTRDGLWNLGWCIGGLSLDIVSVGTAGTALRATKLGAKVATNIIGHTAIMLSAQAVQEISNIPRSDHVDVSSL